MSDGSADETNHTLICDRCQRPIKTDDPPTYRGERYHRECYRQVTSP